MNTCQDHSINIQSLVTLQSCTTSMPHNDITVHSIWPSPSIHIQDAKGDKDACDDFPFLDKINERFNNFSNKRPE
jgi:hypothetical protein